MATASPAALAAAFPELAAVLAAAFPAAAFPTAA